MRRSFLQAKEPPLLVVKLADGPHVDLVQLPESIQRVKTVLKLSPSDAVAKVAAWIEAGRVDACRLIGPDAYAELGDDNTMWWPTAAELQFFDDQSASNVVRRFGERVAAKAWAYLNDPRRTSKVLPVLENGPAEVPLIGPAGLAELVRRSVDAYGNVALPRGVVVAVREDQLQQLLDSASPHPQTAPVHVLPARLAEAADSGQRMSGDRAERLIGVQRRQWKDGAGRWSDAVLDSVNKLNSAAGGGHSLQNVAAALGIKRASLEEALRRQTARRDRVRQHQVQAPKAA